MDSDSPGPDYMISLRLHNRFRTTYLLHEVLGHEPSHVAESNESNFLSGTGGHEPGQHLVGCLAIIRLEDHTEGHSEYLGNEQTRTEHF